MIESHRVLVPEGPDIDVQPVSLGRSKTTITVPADARERIMASRRDTDPPAAIVSRSNTTLGRLAQANPPTRGHSLRKPSLEDGAPPAPPKPSMQTISRGSFRISLLTILQGRLRV